MHDVVCEVVLAAGDEDLAATDAVGAIARRLGLAAHLGKVAAGLWLGQVHRRQPLPAGQPGQVAILQLGAAMRAQAVVGTVQQARVHGPAVVGRGDHLVEGGIQQHRQSLAAVRRVAGERGPAAVDKGAVGLAIACGRLHFTILPGAAFDVGGAVDRRQNARGELAGLLEHRASGVGVEIGEGRQVAPGRRRAQDIFDHELHVAQRWGVGPHDRFRLSGVPFAAPHPAGSLRR